MIVENHGHLFVSGFPIQARRIDWSIYVIAPIQFDSSPAVSLVVKSNDFHSQVVHMYVGLHIFKLTCRRENPQSPSIQQPNDHNK